MKHAITCLLAVVGSALCQINPPPRPQFTPIPTSSRSVLLAKCKAMELHMCKMHSFKGEEGDFGVYDNNLYFVTGAETIYNYVQHRPVSVKERVNARLVVFDLSASGHPPVISETDLGWVEDPTMHFDNGRMLLASSNGSKVIDISNPRVPRELQAMDHQFHWNAVLDGDSVFFAVGNETEIWYRRSTTLYEYNWKSGMVASTVLPARNRLPYVAELVVLGSYVYLADGEHLRVFMRGTLTQVTSIAHNLRIPGKLIHNLYNRLSVKVVAGRLALFPLLVAEPVTREMVLPILELFDVTSPSAPVSLGVRSWDTTRVLGVNVAGGTAMVQGEGYDPSFLMNPVTGEWEGCIDDHMLGPKAMVGNRVFIAKYARVEVSSLEKCSGNLSQPLLMLAVLLSLSWTLGW